MVGEGRRTSDPRFALANIEGQGSGAKKLPAEVYFDTNFCASLLVLSPLLNQTDRYETVPEIGAIFDLNGYHSVLVLLR
jgi:hypothetical protein